MPKHRDLLGYLRYFISLNGNGRMDKSAAVKVSDPSMVIDDLKLMQTLHLPNILAQHRLRNGDIKTRLYPPRICVHVG